MISRFSCWVISHPDHDKGQLGYVAFRSHCQYEGITHHLKPNGQYSQASDPGLCFKESFSKHVQRHHSLFQYYEIHAISHLKQAKGKSLASQLCYFTRTSLHKLEIFYSVTML